MPMFDGFKTLIKFTNIGNVDFAEVTVKPPGLDGRGPIDTSSMRNSQMITKYPKSLINVTDVTSTVQWNPGLLIDLINGVLNKNQFIKVSFPNNSVLSFYGWLDKFEPNEHREGEVPLATMTVPASNVNANGVEVIPSIVQGGF